MKTIKGLGKIKMICIKFRIFIVFLGAALFIYFPEYLEVIGVPHDYTFSVVWWK